MNKEELIKQGLTDEQASKVMSMYKEALKGQVPQSRLDEVVKERNELREKTAQQLEALSKSNGDVDGLKAQIAKMQEDNEKAIKAANEKYQALQLDTAISKMAADSGAYDVKALKAYLDVTEAKPDSDGVYRTIQTQIDALKADASKSFLFKPSEPPKPATPQVKGANIQNGLGKPNENIGYQERWRNAIKEGNTAEAVAIKGEAAAEGVFF